MSTTPGVGPAPDGDAVTSADRSPIPSAADDAPGTPPSGVVDAPDPGTGLVASEATHEAAEATSPVAEHIPGSEAGAAPGFVPPRTAGSGTTLGLLLSVVLLGVAVVLVHDGLVLLGVVGGPEWIRATADAIGVLTPTTVLAWVGAGVAVIGLILLVAALIPRRRYGQRLRGDGGLYLREVDVARLSSGAARSVGSVLEASSTASRRAVVVRVRTTIDRDAGELTKTAVTERLAVLRQPLTVVVRTRRPR